MGELRFLQVTLESWDEFEKLYGSWGVVDGCWCMWLRIKRVATPRIICYSVDLGGECMTGDDLCNVPSLLSSGRIMRAGDADPRLSLRRRRREIALRILY
jgi:hypothetical protein